MAPPPPLWRPRRAEGPLRLTPAGGKPQQKHLVVLQFWTRCAPVFTHWQVLLLLQGGFLLPESLSELGQASLRRCDLQVPLAQAVFVLLQPAALILVQLVPQLKKTVS